MDGTPTFVMKGTGLKRREFLKFGLAAGTGLSAHAILGNPLISQALAQRKKNEITIAIGSDIHSLWPMAHSTTDPGNTVMDSIFDKLTYFGPCASGSGTQQLEPGLATSWKLTGNAWIINIRKGIKFHNGAAFTAADVVQSLNDARAPRSLQSGPIGIITELEAVDEYTVRLVTRVPLAQQMWGVASVPIFSAAVKKQYGKEISKHAIGTGLFKQVEWIPGERLVVERVSDWWGFKAAGNQPFNKENNIERITWRTIKQPIAMITALETGEIDVAQYVLPHEVDRLRKKKTLSISKVEHTRNGLLIMNQRFKPLDDVRVRKAINYGVDWGLINKQLLGGKVDNSFGPILPGQVGYDGTLKPYPFDPDKARKLLIEAGHGKGLDLEITAARSGVELKRVEQCEAMAQQLRKIGINLKVNAVDFGYFLQNYFRNKLSFYIFAIKAEPDPWLYIIYLLYSRTYGKPNSGKAGWQNAKFDALFEQASATTDIKKRGHLYKQMMAIAHDEAALVWRSALHDFRGTRSNIDYNPTCMDTFLHPQLMSVKS